VKYWFDTEFIEDGVTIDLLSIGVVCEDGREFYAQNRDANLDAASEWVRDNVFPGMRDCPDERILHKEQLRSALYYFIEYGEGTPEFWAYYGDYDWVVLCQLFGTMMDLPEGWPMFAMDVKQLAVSLGSPELPPQDSAEHNALNDARWTRDAWKFLAVPVLETPAEAVFCDHSQWRECAATLEMVRDLSDKALNYTAAYDLANDLAAILAGSDDAIPGALVEPVPAPSENLNKGEEMIALFDEVKLDGFTIQFKDKEQMEANKTADNSPTPWSEKTPLAESVKRWKSQGQTATLLLVYGVVLAMTGGPNHFARTVIDQHVIVGSNPVRVVSMKISNE
jgi:hypothetical protein